MPIELRYLGAVLVLALVQIFATGQARTRQYGVAWNMSPRDGEMPPPSPLVGRLARAQANLFETLPLFAAAVLGALAAGRLGWKTSWGAGLYFWCRLAYVPLYAAGVPGVRSLVWMGGTLGLVLILWALLFG